MKTGTCYFPTYGAALRYYRPYAENPEQYKGVTRDQRLRRLVDIKLNEGEIHIGRPDVKPGEPLRIGRPLAQRLRRDPIGPAT